jgi:broad specificity phosphatase PhoE
MSSLTLVRHAQASFFADDYDQLSAIGENQARILGEAWVRSQRAFDEAYVGPRQRQQQTAALVANCYRELGLSFPEPVVVPELDEYDLAGIARHLVPEMAKQNLEFATLLGNHRMGTTEDERARNFQKMFEPLMLHWLTAEAIDGLEGWLEFRNRVQRALKQIVNRPGRGRKVVAFTSGGFIGTTVQWVLGAPDRCALEMNWRIRNGSVTEFVFSQGRITLDSFNSVAHFAAPELMTYR